ncbi:MAG: hypothetical protein JSR37_08175 [Verrucomicrobia bacterium]|nr:hypothetical protein [Verrucomicrobiota bacterium]MBS0637035.1 hypothetical protein [Verrucomicrobiota bacterium]
MMRKKTFTLIEVLIAIFIATGACFFLLEFEESYIKSARASLKKVQKERMIQEAYVVLLEQLYTNQIPWKAIEDQATVPIPLSDENYQATATFMTVPHGNSEQVSQPLLDVKVIIKMGEQQELSEIRLCLKKEEHIDEKT